MILGGLKVTNVTWNLLSENKLIIIHVSCVYGIQSLQVVELNMIAGFTRDTNRYATFSPCPVTV